ncbi:MAG: MFS transporter [bacterium]
MTSPAAAALRPASRGPIERLLGLFADVERGEGVTALLLTLNVYLLLTTYYIIKPVREALILAGGGAEVKSYAAFLTALLLLLFVPQYARLASRLPRRRLINSVTLFFAACLVAFWALARAKVPHLGVAFFLWVGIFNMSVIAQFWSFANDVYTPAQGKRLFAIVAFGASLGAVSGSWIAGQLIGPLGVTEMLLVAAGILVASLGLTNAIDRRERARPTEDSAPTEPLGGSGAFDLVRKNRYLLRIAMLMLVLNCVNTTGEYILGKVVSTTAAERVAAGTSGGLSEGQWIGKFYADFFTVVNVVGLLTQLFLVSRVLKYLGVRTALLFLPVIAFGGYLLLAFYPALAFVRWAKTAENAADYSIQNTVRNVLFLPTTREQKYKAKQAIDTFFVRMGDGLSALLVFVGTGYLGFHASQFAMVNLALVVAWILLAVAVGRQNAQLMKTGESDH